MGYSATNSHYVRMRLGLQLVFAFPVAKMLDLRRLLKTGLVAAVAAVVFIGISPVAAVETAAATTGRFGGFSLKGVLSATQQHRPHRHRHGRQKSRPAHNMVGACVSTCTYVSLFLCLYVCLSTMCGWARGCGNL